MLTFYFEKCNHRKNNRVNWLQIPPYNRIFSADFNVNVGVWTEVNWLRRRDKRLSQSDTVGVWWRTVTRYATRVVLTRNVARHDTFGSCLRTLSGALSSNLISFVCQLTDQLPFAILLSVFIVHIHQVISSTLSTGLKVSGCSILIHGFVISADGGLLIKTMKAKYIMFNARGEMSAAVWGYRCSCSKLMVMSARSIAHNAHANMWTMCKGCNVYHVHHCSLACS